VKLLDARGSRLWQVRDQRLLDQAGKLCDRGCLARFLERENGRNLFDGYAVDEGLRERDRIRWLPFDHPHFAERTSASLSIHQFAPWNIDQIQAVEQRRLQQPSFGTQIQLDLQLEHGDVASRVALDFNAC